MGMLLLLLLGERSGIGGVVGGSVRWSEDAKYSGLVFVRVKDGMERWGELRVEGLVDEEEGSARVKDTRRGVVEKGGGRGGRNGLDGKRRRAGEGIEVGDKRC